MAKRPYLLMTDMCESQPVFQSLSENGNLSKEEELFCSTISLKGGLFLQVGTLQQTVPDVLPASPLAWQRIPMLPSSDASINLSTSQ